MPRSDLFPPIRPRHHGMLRVDARHTLYYEECGAHDGIPAVFLHGGPGAGAAASHRRFFDPTAYRIIIFDQRGAGRSVPTADVTDNTTAHLIDDIEALRRHLNIDAWLLFGGSWGSTLSLAYAQTYPERCLGLILRGIFLGSEDEINWFMVGIRHIFPEAWARFAAVPPQAEQGDLLNAYYKRLIDPDPTVHLPVARAWSAYEATCSTLLPSPVAFADDSSALTIARIEAHYFVNRVFLGRDVLLHNLNHIRRLPAVIVHGRYDMICPIVTADQLHKEWPEAHYIVVPDAGHAALEPGIRAALVQATEYFKVHRNFK